MKIKFDPKLGEPEKEFWANSMTDSVLHFYIKMESDCGYLYPSVKIVFNSSTKTAYVLSTNIVRLCTRKYEGIKDKNQAKKIYRNPTKDFIELKSHPCTLDVFTGLNVDSDPIEVNDNYDIYIHEDKYAVFSRHKYDKNGPSCIALAYKVESDLVHIRTDLCAGPDSYITAVFSIPYVDKALDALKEVMHLRYTSIEKRNACYLLNVIKYLDIHYGIKFEYADTPVDSLLLELKNKPAASYIQFINYEK